MASPPRRQLGGVLAGLVAVGGILTVAAVVGGPPGPDRRPGLHLSGEALVLAFDALVGALFTAAVLVVLLLGWAVATVPRRSVPHPRPWWRQPAQLGILAALVLLMAWLVELGWFGDPVTLLLDSLWANGVDPAAREAAGAGVDGLIDPAQRWIAGGVGGLAVILAAAAGLRWLLRAEADPAAASTAEEAAGEAALVAAVDAALGDLDTDPDARRAVLCCYAHLDRALAEAGCPRGESETAREHQRRAAEMLGPGASAAAEVVHRFEHARYDDRPVGEADRWEAMAALERVREVLRARAGTPIGGQS